MKKVKLIFGTNNSQPLGARDDEIEESYQTSYKPFLKTLYNFPDVALTLHFSGVLLQWLERKHSEFIDVLSEMASRRQVELLGGAFYDPVLALIPRQDRLGQIERMTTFLRKQFGRRPRGAWVTEYVWEPTFASTYSTSGIDYIFLDDHHFTAGGLSGGDMYRPCITEDQGRILTVFPVCNVLRSGAPRISPDDVIERVRSAATEKGDRIVSLMMEGESLDCRNGDDGCYDQSWLTETLTKIRENSEWLQPVVPPRYLRSFVPRRRTYFPTTSYAAMQSWSEPHRANTKPKSSKQCEPAPSGFFRHFLVKYPESNLMYAKMQYTHVLVNQVRGDKYRKLAAREELWRGQCHHAYWHGRPGGIYRNALRKSVYSSLIEAEKVTRERGIFIPSVIAIDFDMDGVQEYLYQGHDMNAYVHSEGGTLFELDYLPISWNFLDTMARHPEPYHTEDVRALGYDTYRRSAFIDHFFGKDATIADFDVMKYREAGGFLDTRYTVTDYKRENREVALTASSYVEHDSQRYPVEITKKYSFKKGGFSVAYTITNRSENALYTFFGSEINLSAVSREVDVLRLYVAKGETETEIGPTRTSQNDVDLVRFLDLTTRTTITLKFSVPAELWSLPVETVYRTADGIGTEYQSSCLLPRWSLAIEPGASWRGTIDARIERV